MPIDPKALLKGLKPILKTLDADLLDRAQDAGVEAALKTAWQREKTASRTAANFNLWRRRRVTQISIAWVLSIIFVRTLEDRDLLARRRIAGPGAEDSEQQFVALAPFLTPRDYLLMVFRELAKLPGATDVFDAPHNPVWALAPSADGARQLLDFFRQPGKKGEGPPSFEGEDTRFLGDLYQNLSEDVRKRYALLQTPVFIEEFILDQTLDPAVRAFGLDEVRLIDPTCGSGHFLLGAFHRLLNAWQDKAPGQEQQVLAQRALSQIYGCDLNPYAVAIARFRLTLEFLQACGIDRLERAPRLPLNLCVADSLLHGVTKQQLLSSPDETNENVVWGDQLFDLEDETEALRILKQQYHAVVGNPPYITEKDTKKREEYRKLYTSAAGKFALAAPFVERFFDIAVRDGFVGMINANSFTKRDFGKALIEQVLPKLDVKRIVDTSGAYIPGHGIPTLLLFGRNREPGPDAVTAVLGKRGEAEEPLHPSRAPVWTEIVAHHDEVGFEGRHVSVEPIPLDEVAKHPWVLAGGGARAMKNRLESTTQTNLESVSDSIGVVAVLGSDEVYLVPSENVKRARPGTTRLAGQGEDIRDWAFFGNHVCPWVYTPEYKVQEPGAIPDAIRYFWPNRATLSRRKRFGVPMLKKGLRWYELQELYHQKLDRPLTLVVAFVTTHNHFYLDRDRVLFKNSTRTVELKDHYDEDDHLALLGVLNSSTVGLWCRLVMFQKGGDRVGDGARVAGTPWEDRLEYAGNLLKALPIPDLTKAREALLTLVREAESTVNTLQASAPSRVLHAAIEDNTTKSAALRELQDRTTATLQRLQAVLVSIQEEIDWRVYELYGLPTLTALSIKEVLVPVAPEHRPFEVRLARDVDDDLSASIWFERHKRTPPKDVGGPLADLYRRRLRLTEESKELQLLETPETKRRWPPRDYDAEFRDAYRSWLLDRIEALLEAQTKPAAMSARQVAAELQRDEKFQAVAEVYTGESDPDLERLVTDLVKREGVPFLAALRYTTTGLEKYEAWCETWELQRREDAGEDVGEIPVPPKYATKDYRSNFWDHRKELDVPKERFVLYPGAETENDASPWLGWAGWDRLQRATALSAICQHRKNEEGWEKEKLIPLLAGLHELVPWLIQWHNEPSATYGGQRLGDFFRDFVGGEAHRLGCSVADLEAWRPPETPRGRGRAKKASSAPKLTVERLMTAFEENGGELAQRDLATHLGVSSTMVGKVAKTCIEEGLLVQTSGRPKRFALASSVEEES